MTGPKGSPRRGGSAARILRSHEEHPIENDRHRCRAAGSSHSLFAALACHLSPLALFLVAPVSPLAAQDGDQSSRGKGPLVLELASSTRSVALGGAFWTGGDGNLAIFHHPSLVAGEGFGGSRQRIGGSTHLALSGSGSWMGGTVAAGLSVLTYGTSADSPLELPREAAELIAGGHGAASEFTAAVGFADELFGMGVGAAAKLVGQRLGGLSGSTVAVDLGLGRELGPITAAVTVQNLGSALKLGRYETPLARRVVVGAGTNGRAPVGPLDIGGAVQVARRGDGEIVPGGGLEIAWWPVQRRIFIARIGAVRRVGDDDGSPFTFGAGFEGDRIRIDYAYRDGFTHLDLGADQHSIGIAIR